MIYGDKFLSSIDSIAVVETEIKSVEDIINSINENYLTENVPKVDNLYF